MKVLIRGLNIYDSKSTFINLNEKSTLKQLKRRISRENKAFKRCKYVITSNGKIKNDHEFINKDEIYYIKVLVLGGKVD